MKGPDELVVSPRKSVSDRPEVARLGDLDETVLTRDVDSLPVLEYTRRQLARY